MHCTGAAADVWFFHWLGTSFIQQLVAIAQAVIYLCLPEWWRHYLALANGISAGCRRFSLPFSFSAFVRGDSLRSYVKALPFLKLESSGQPSDGHGRWKCLKVGGASSGRGHGERVEREPIMGVWGRSPLKLSFLVLERPAERQNLSRCQFLAKYSIGTWCRFTLKI